MDYLKYINGVAALARAVCIEQQKPRENETEGLSIYTGRTPNKVPSIPLEAGESYFSVHTEEDFLKVFRGMSKRYLRRNLMTLSEFVEYFRQFCERDAYSIVFVPCHSSMWRAAFASPREDGTMVPVNPNVVRRAIKLAIKVGLLAVYEKGSFRRSMERMGMPSKYLYNKKVEKYITAKFKEHGIDKADFRRVTRDATKARVAREMSDGELVSKIRIGTGLNLPDIHDETVYRVLQRHYPMLREHMEDLEAVNGLVKGISPEFHRLAMMCGAVKIRRGKNNRITSISYRPYSKAALMKSGDREVELCRQAKKRAAHWDRRASIYSITRVLNCGKFTPHTEDLYQSMSGWLMTQEERSDYKHGLSQRLYFGASDKSCMNHILRLGRDVEDICSRVDGWNVVREASRRMREVVGPSYGSEIFLHEACIYVRALRKLLERGEKVLLVYDCFYFLDSKLRGRDVEDVVRSCAMEYYRKWFANRAA